MQTHHAWSAHTTEYWAPTAAADNSPRNTDNTTRSFSSGLFFEAFAMLISLRQTQTAD